MVECMKFSSNKINFSLLDLVQNNLLILSNQNTYLFIEIEMIN